jgi:phospholipid/cholesterol/gamma-HCH transport system substrate-binding protein
MQNKSHAIAAGTFVLVVSAMAIGMAVWLTRDSSQQRVYELSSRESVTGLQPQAGVSYKGVSVGRVTAIELDPQTRGNVLVRIAVDEQAPITQSTFATLGFQGVTGLAFVQLDDTGESTQELATSAQQVARIPMRAGLMSRLTDQGGNLLGQLEQASQRIKVLLGPDNQKSLMVAIDNMGTAAANISKLSARADQMLSTPPGTEPLNLPRVAEQAGATFKSMQATSDRLAATADAVSASANEFKRMSARLSEPGGTLDKIAQSADALVATGQSVSATLTPRVGRTADDAARAARQVGRAVDMVNDNPQSMLLGKGTAPPGPGESGFVAPPAKR